MPTTNNLKTLYSTNVGALRTNNNNRRNNVPTIQLTQHHQHQDQDLIKQRIKSAFWSNIQANLAVDTGGKSLLHNTKDSESFNFNTFAAGLNKATTIDVTQVGQDTPVYQVRVKVNPSKLKDSFIDVLNNKVNSLMRKRSPDGSNPLGFLDEIVKSSETALFAFSFNVEKNLVSNINNIRTAHRSPNRWIDGLIYKSIDQMNDSIFFVKEK